MNKVTRERCLKERTSYLSKSLERRDDVTLKELKSETTNEGGSNCPTDKVTDTDTSNIEYNNSIIYSNETITTPTSFNQDLNSQPSIPTHRSIKEGTYDIIDEMEAYLMELENEINNETTEEDMELKLKTPSFGDITEEEREFNNDTNEDTIVHSEKEGTLDIISDFEGNTMYKINVEANVLYL